jgi:hypothetical protein
MSAPCAAQSVTALWPRALAAGLCEATIRATGPQLGRLRRVR